MKWLTEAKLHAVMGQLNTIGEFTVYLKVPAQLVTDMGNIGAGHR